MDNERYVIKYYYNDNFIGYHNSYGESRGMVWTRIYAGNDSQYIKKYNSLQGAKIASNSPYYSYSHDLIINTEETYIELVGTDHPFLKINIALSHPDFEDEELSFSITTPINYPIY